MCRKLMVAAFIFLSIAVAHGQVAMVYVTYAPIHLSNVQTGNQAQYTDFWASGVGGGVTINFLPLPVVSLGLDLRGSTKPGTVGADTAMVGLKLGIRPPVIRIKPYVQASAGYLGTRTYSTSIATNSTSNNDYITWEILGGIDYPLMHFVDFRIVEVGAGQGWNTGSGGNANIFTVNTGLVLHF